MKNLYEKSIFKENAVEQEKNTQKGLKRKDEFSPSRDFALQADGSKWGEFVNSKRESSKKGSTSFGHISLKKMEWELLRNVIGRAKNPIKLRGN